MPEEQKPNPNFGFDSIDAEMGPPGAVEPPEGMEPEPEPAPQPTPEPKAAAPITPGDPGMDYFARMQEWDRQKAAEEDRRKANEKAAADWLAKWDTAFKPVATPEDTQKLVLEDEALLRHLNERDARNERIQRQLLDELIAARRDAWQMVQSMQADAASAAVQMQSVSAQVGAQLRSEGFADVDEAMSEADKALRANPQQYLSYRTNPQAFDAAVRFVISNRKGDRARPAARQAAAPVAPSGSLPYTPGQPTSPQSATAAPVSRRAITAAERAMGIKIRPETIQRFGGGR